MCYIKTEFVVFYYKYFQIFLLFSLISYLIFFSPSTCVLFNNFASSFCFFLCSLLYISFSLAICYSFSIALSTFILLWIPKLRKCTQFIAGSTNYFQWFPRFFLSLNILPIIFIFSSTHCFLINTLSSKLIQPITTSLCVPCTIMWKHWTHHYEWTLQISSSDYSTSIISLHYRY